MRFFVFLMVIVTFTHALVPRQDDEPPRGKLTPGPRYERLDKTNALLLMVDFQEGIINMVKDWDTALFKSNILGHSALAQVFSLPVIITTSAAQGPNGAIPKEITAMHPNATIIERQGDVNPWDNKEFREAVRASGKSHIIIAGISTDVCTAFPALSLREEGYNVWANAEASGTTSLFSRDLGNDRMRGAGVQLMSLLSLMAELMRSWTAAPGARELLPWMDEHIPHYAFVARAHGHAILDGVILPGEDEILQEA